MLYFPNRFYFRGSHVSQPVKLSTAIYPLLVERYVFMFIMLDNYFHSIQCLIVSLDGPDSSDNVLLPIYRKNYEQDNKTSPVKKDTENYW